MKLAAEKVAPDENMNIQLPETSKIIESMKTLRKNVNSILRISALSNRQSNTLSTQSLLVFLHSTITPATIFAALTLLTFRAYFGNEIDCFGTQNSDVPPQMILRYCWMEGIFSVVEEQNSKNCENSIYPGVRQLSKGDNQQQRVYHRYYQWVYFTLTIQALLFYLPKYVWRRCDVERYLENLLLKSGNDDDENRYFIVGNCTNRRKGTTAAVDDNKLMHVTNTGNNDEPLFGTTYDFISLGKTWFLYYLSCDILCTLNVIAQIWFTNVYLNGDFAQLGLAWYNYAVNKKNTVIDSKCLDPLIRTFPRLVKCSFHTFGPSATIQTRDALCMLPQNIVNEKIYLFLWVWFLLLLFVSSTSAIFRLLYLFPYIRYVQILQHAPRCKGRKDLMCVCRDLGKWFACMLIAQNVSPNIFVAFLDAFASFQKQKHMVAGNTAKRVSLKSSNICPVHLPRK